MILGIVDDIVVALLKLLILLVAGIYKLVSGFYQIFLILSRTNIFDQDTYQHLTDKVYVILAVVMLFVLAYNFITLIIDPDKNKGGSVVEKIIKNAVTSLILIVICPTLFSFAFDLQDAILNQGVITKFFTIDNPVSGKPYDAAESIQQGGNMMAAYTFKAFFAPAHDGDNSANVTNKGKGKNYNGANCGSVGGCTLAQAEAYAEKTGTFAIYTAFAANWHESDAKMGVDFSFLMAIVAGGYLIYVIISFCFDLAVRVIKLAFYQIIAPICIACRILPEKESIFKNWWKAVVKTYLSVFIRIFIMNMAVFLMILITNDKDLIPSVCPTCSLAVRLLAYAFLIMGLLMFVKQSTKLIDEIFQLGDVSLGIKDKWKESTSLITSAAGTGAAIGFGAAGLVKGTINGHGNPLAGIRAARMNAKNKNLSGNKAEFERRRAYEVALQNGATRSDLARDYLRNKLGMASLQEQRDYEIDDIMHVNDGHGGTLHYDRVDVEQADGTIRQTFCIVDSAGNTIRTLHDYNAATDSALLGRQFEYTSSYAQQAKLDSEAAERRIKQLDDEIRSMEQINASNQTIMSYRKAAMQRVQDKLTEGRGWWGDITRSTTYTDTSGVTHTLEGNYNTLQAGLEELLKRTDISDTEKAALQRKVSELREKIEFAALNEASTVGGAHADGNIIGQMQKITDAINAGELRNVDNSIAVGQADIAGRTSEEIVEMVKKNVGRVATDTEVQTRSIKSDKGTEEARRKDIAHVENMHTDTLQEQKQTPDYQGIQASAQHISNNPNVLSSNNGSNKSGSKKNPNA